MVVGIRHINFIGVVGIKNQFRLFTERKFFIVDEIAYPGFNLAQVTLRTIAHNAWENIRFGHIPGNGKNSIRSGKNYPVAVGSTQYSGTSGIGHQRCWAHNSSLISGAIRQKAGFGIGFTLIGIVKIRTHHHYMTFIGAGKHRLFIVAGI